MLSGERLEAGADVLVPGRADPLIAILGIGEFVRGNAKDLVPARRIGVVQTKAVWQRDCSRLHSVINFYQHVYAAALRHEPGRSGILDAERTGNTVTVRVASDMCSELPVMP